MSFCLQIYIYIYIYNSSIKARFRETAEKGTNEMKKYIALLLALVLCVSLCACGTKKLGEEVKGGMTDEHVGIVTEVVKEYMETDNYKALAERTECKGVKSAIYYQAEFAVEGINLELILVELDMDMDIAGSACTLVIDLRDGVCYDEQALDMGNYMGQMESYEDLMKMAYGGFFSWLKFDDVPAIMTEMEVRTPATKDQIKTINAALNG